LSFLSPFVAYWKNEIRNSNQERENSQNMGGTMTARNKWTASFSVFAVGVGVGAALGVLFAPRSGNDTRDHLLESAQDYLDGAVAAGQKLTQRAQEGIDQIKSQVRQAADVGERAYRDAKNLSS
jgi:gas vesicle protein